MPLIQKPSIKGIGTSKNHKDKHAVSFSYSFSGDTSAPIVLGALQLTGSSYTLDTSQLSSANIESIKTLQVSATFPRTANNELIGGLFIYSSVSGQIITLNPLCLNPAVYAGEQGIICATVPIVTGSPSRIVFAKQDNNTGALLGDMMVTAFDFELPPFINTGFSTGF